MSDVRGLMSEIFRSRMSEFGCLMLLFIFTQLFVIRSLRSDVRSRMLFPVTDLLIKFFTTTSDVGGLKADV